MKPDLPTHNEERDSMPPADTQPEAETPVHQIAPFQTDSSSPGDSQVEKAPQDGVPLADVAAEGQQSDAYANDAEGLTASVSDVLKDAAEPQIESEAVVQQLAGAGEVDADKRLVADSEALLGCKKNYESRDTVRARESDVHDKIEEISTVSVEAESAQEADDTVLLSGYTELSARPAGHRDSSVPSAVRVSTSQISNNAAAMRASMGRNRISVDFPGHGIRESDLIFVDIAVEEQAGGDAPDQYATARESDNAATLVAGASLLSHTAASHGGQTAEQTEAGPAVDSEAGGLAEAGAHAHHGDADADSSVCTAPW